MNLFPKFDPRSVSCETDPTPAKVAKVAKVVTQIPLESPTLATLATLADPHDDFDERAGIIEFDGEIPKEWAEGLARLCTMPKPSNVSLKRWQNAIDAAGSFADRWAAQASALGWTTLNIFGVDALKPEVALHTAGLIWLLQDKKIFAITANAVIVETVTGVHQTFRSRLARIIHGGSGIRQWA